VGLPAIPFLSTFHELNARTYVHRDGVPGVWFFSLDAGSRIAVAAARRLYRLPYYAAAIEVAEEDGRVRYRARRTHARARPARFEADWIPGDPIPESAPGSLEFFLTERYVLFAEGAGRLYRAPIHHPPWPLRTATVLTLRSSLLEAASLPTPGVEPLAHHARRVDVEVWRLERA
jgi:uncharacterized protein YqjF (DUF2071 family)